MVHRNQGPAKSSLPDLPTDFTSDTKTSVSEKEDKPSRRTPNNVYVRRHRDRQKMFHLLMKKQYSEIAEKIRSLEKTCEVLTKVLTGLTLPSGQQKEEVSSKAKSTQRKREGEWLGDPF